MAAKKRDRKPPPHGDKDVKKIVSALLRAGWAVEHPGGHAWGWLCCSGIPGSKPECSILVKSSPKGSSQAKILRREVRKCDHGHAGDLS